MWSGKGPPEPPEPGPWLKQERVADKPSHRLVEGAFGELLPPPTLTHAQTSNRRQRGHQGNC